MGEDSRLAVSEDVLIPLLGLPTPVKVPGRGKVRFGPHGPARSLAAEYIASAGLGYVPIKEYAQVDEARATRIAAAYTDMRDEPQAPRVRAAYDAMIRETLAQFQIVKKSRISFELIIDGANDPYVASPRLAILDVIENSHLWVLPTSVDFGPENKELVAASNPLLAETNEFIGDVRLCANDVFRIVHDYFGHIKEGVGFRADGEENAWRCHAAMYSRAALGAITTELRGQNSWLNFGPHGNHNRTAKAADTVYADQKVGLLPEWVWDEGRGDPP